MNTDKFLDNVGLAHLWKRITAYVQGAVPKKMSELKNDMGYTSNGVTSFNGSTGAVVYHGVDTVNGKRGNVQLAIPTKTSELENDSGFITEGGTIDAYTKSQTDTLLSGKQDTIDDLSNIRSGAALGTTALQSYTETDPTVPQWAKASTKPTYTAQEVGALPANTPLPTGIPSGGTTGQVLKKTSGTDYAVEWGNESGGGTIEQVQADWDENNTEDPAYIKNKPTIPSLSGYATEQWVTQQNYLTGYTETDPIFTASAAHGITSSDISNWNSKTSNVGTITGITMNGASKGTSGVVDLGTVITDVSGKVDKTTTINGKALSSNVALSASDVGALPSSTVIPAAQVNADWDASSGVAQILNKPTIPTVTGKADKVSNATNGHLAGLDANGNLTDSGFKIVVTDETTYEGMTKDSNTIYLITES